jgi:murein L,D-transpeptidase YafK
MNGGRALVAAVVLAGVSAGVGYCLYDPLPAGTVLVIPEKPLRLPLKAPRLVIRKKARELSLYDGPELLRSYRVALGANTAGAKEREGDRRTPEGAFYLCTRNDASRFHKFMGLSYPAPPDAARGLRANLISRAEHDAILDAHRKKECPPWKTALGGEVGIHGGGADRDWTLGCIALSNAAVDELWAALKTGDPVQIEP